MSFIAQDFRFRKALKVWAEQKKLMITKFFFWRIGSDEQKSESGLIRSTMFQLLSRYRKFASSLVTPAEGIIPAWTDRRLRKSLFQLIDHTRSDSKICMVIDGLDELKGSEESQEPLMKLVDLVKRLFGMSDIKILVSSRPEPILFGAFSQYEGMRLQDLNHEAIRTYVEGQLLHDERIAHRQASSVSRIFGIADTVCQKSDGVFLWTRLAVEYLKSGLRANDSLDLLEKRLSLLDRSLEKLFVQLLEQIDPVYKSNSANLFAMMVVRARLEPLVHEIHSDQELSLLHVAFARDSSLAENSEISHIYMIQIPVSFDRYIQLSKPLRCRFLRNQRGWCKSTIGTARVMMGRLIFWRPHAHQFQYVPLKTQVALDAYEPLVQLL